MDIDIQEVLRFYRDELAVVKEEAIIRKVAQLQLERENEQLKQQIAALTEQLEKMGGSED